MTTFCKLAALSLMALVPAAPALAMDAKIYPYASKANYCPSGLQPIQINGVICCGTPNQNVSYQSLMTQGSPRKARRAMATKSSAVCPEGQKGCYMQ